MTVYKSTVDSKPQQTLSLLRLPQLEIVMAKKGKISDLNRTDLVLAMDAIEKVRRSLTCEESGIEEPDEIGDSGKGLATVLSLKARVGEAKV